MLSLMHMNILTMIIRTILLPMVPSKALLLTPMVLLLLFLLSLALFTMIYQATSIGTILDQVQLRGHAFPRTTTLVQWTLAL